MNKTTTPRITIGMLRGACKEQRDIFRKEWPEGADATIENARRARELGLNLAWGEHWFTAAALEVYEEAPFQARKVYLEAVTQAWEAYIEATAPARKAHREATAQAWKAYIEARATAWKAREEAIATAWVAAYIQSVAEREVAK